MTKRPTKKGMTAQQAFEAPPIVVGVAAPEKTARGKTGNSAQAPQLDPWKWKPGQSGNPNGRPRSSSEMKLRAAASTDDVMEILELRKTIVLHKLRGAVDVLNDPDASADAKAAALLALGPSDFDVVDRLLDRGHGKPQQNVAIDTNSAIDALSLTERQALFAARASRIIGLRQKREAAQKAKK